MDFIYSREEMSEGLQESLYRLESYGWVRIARKVVDLGWIPTNLTIAVGFDEGLDKANQEGKAIQIPCHPRNPVHYRKISQGEAAMILFQLS